MWFGYNSQIILSHFFPNIVSYGQSWFMEKPFCLPWAVMASKAKYFLSTLDSYGRKRNRFCLLWKVIVGRGTVLSAIDSYLGKSKGFGLALAVMVGRAKNFVCHWQLWFFKQIVLSRIGTYSTNQERPVVCHGQEYLIYQLNFFVIGSYGWYSTRFCLSWAVMVGISRVLSVMDNNGWYITPFCLSRTKMVGITPSFVCHG